MRGETTLRSISQSLRKHKEKHKKITTKKGTLLSLKKPQGTVSLQNYNVYKGQTGITSKE